MVFAACTALIACERRDPVDDPEANSTAGLPTVNEPAPSATGEPRGDATQPASGLPAAEAAIPVALQGRWGLTPGDCTSTRGDAKGLLVITGDRLRFYESVAVPDTNVDKGPESISGDFAFTGEGQSWTKFQSIKLQRQELVRTETNPAASFTYAKCT